MTTISTLTVDVNANTSRFRTGMRVAAAGIAAVAAGAAIAVKEASDLEEAQNKVTAVFGKQGKAMLAWSEDAATAFGLSRTEALSAAGTYGNLFRNIGLTEQASADMSRELTGLAADFASFNNMGTPEVLEKIRAGLAGEAEPLRAVGVFLNEAKVAQEAYNAGIAKQGEELTDAQKIQARYNIILAEAGKAQGDFARTADSVANQQRIVSAQVKDLAADIGKQLLPIVKQILTVVSRWATALRKLTPEQRENIVKAIAMAAAVGGLVIAIGKLAPALKLAAGAMGALKTQTGAANGTMLAWGVAIGLVAEAGRRTWGWLKQDEDMASAWHDEIRRGLGSLGDYQRGVAEVTEESNALFDAIDGDLKVMQGMDILTAELTAKWRAQADAVRANNGVSDAFVRIMTEAQGVTRKQAGQVVTMLNAVDRLTTDGLTPLLEMQVRNLLAMGDFEGAMRLLNRAMDDGIRTMRNYVNWGETLEGQIADTSKAAFAANQNLAIWGNAGGRGGGGRGGGGRGGGNNNGATPGLAAGGNAWSGRTYVVGERGPELFVPSTSGTVVPNAGMTVNVYGDVYDAEGFQKRVGAAIRRMARDRSSV